MCGEPMWAIPTRRYDVKGPLCKGVIQTVNSLLVMIYTLGDALRCPVKFISMSDYACLVASLQEFCWQLENCDIESSGEFDCVQVTSKDLICCMEGFPLVALRFPSLSISWSFRAAAWRQWVVMFHVQRLTHFHVLNTLSTFGRS